MRRIDKLGACPIASCNGIDIDPTTKCGVVDPGELDLATVAQLAGQIDELRAASFKRVVLDLSRLEFMDSSGLHLLVELDRRAHTGGQEFAVIPGPPTIQRLFELTGAGDRLRF